MVRGAAEGWCNQLVGAVRPCGPGVATKHGGRWVASRTDGNANRGGEEVLRVRWNAEMW